MRREMFLARLAGLSVPEPANFNLALVGGTA